MKKEYLLKVRHENGATLSIIAQTDNLTRPIYVYYCGQDTGNHYKRIGDAARHIREIAKNWPGASFFYASADKIPVHGCSDWNRELFKYWYCGAELQGHGYYNKH